MIWITIKLDQSPISYLRRIGIYIARKFKHFKLNSYHCFEKVCNVSICNNLMSWTEFKSLEI